MTQAKCPHCHCSMRMQPYEHVTDVLGFKVREGGYSAPTCVECGAVRLTLQQVQRYEQRATATVLRHKPITGPLFRYARRALELTQAELGAELGCAAETISRLENGAHPIARPLALALVALLDTAFYAPPSKPSEPLPEGELVVPTCAA